MQTAGCATSHKYRNVQIYSAKYYKHFAKTVLQIIFTHKKLTYKVKNVCVYVNV